MRRARTWRRTALAVPLALLLAGAVRPTLAATPLEIAIKATDLSKFVAFVEWPPTAFAGPRQRPHATMTHHPDTERAEDTVGQRIRSEEVRSEDPRRRSMRQAQEGEA